MRDTYTNGDPVSLQHNGCDGCSPSVVNGRIVHEHGCPEAWRDEIRECEWCGTEFRPEHNGSRFCCTSCAASFHGNDFHDEAWDEEHADLAYSEGND